MSTQNVEKLINQYLRLKDAKTQLEEQIETIKNLLLEQLPEGGIVDGMKVTITRPKRLNPVIFMKHYPSQTYPQYYKPTPHTEKIKQNLTSQELQEVMQESKPIVMVKQCTR